MLALNRPWGTEINQWNTAKINGGFSCVKGAIWRYCWRVLLRNFCGAFSLRQIYMEKNVFLLMLLLLLLKRVGIKLKRVFFFKRYSLEDCFAFQRFTCGSAMWKNVTMSKSSGGENNAGKYSREYSQRG